MKRILNAVAIAAITVAAPAIAADVGVAVSIGQPGFYGQIDIGNFPQPQVINSHPVIIEGGAVSGPPVYLRVPPEHTRHWERHCREYNACGKRVYFVNENWYNREYAPRYQEMHREHRDEHREEYMDKRGEERRDEYREERRDERRD
jgi:hypothetical protein